jgi:hypothetical protein
MVETYCAEPDPLPSATEQIAMNIPTQTNDVESGISPDSDEGSSRVSRRNMILGGVAVVATISMPKNSLASTPLLNGKPAFEEHQWKG